MVGQTENSYLFRLENCDATSAVSYPYLTSSISACKKQKKFVHGALVISRGCTWKRKDDYTNTCPSTSTSSANEVTSFCETCDYDGCNGAAAISKTIALVLAPLAFCVRCYQCASSQNKEEDTCGAYKKFDVDSHIAVECNSDESHMPGSFCMKLTQQGPKGFIWDGRWRQVVRRCASVAETVTHPCAGPVCAVAQGVWDSPKVVRPYPLKPLGPSMTPCGWVPGTLEQSSARPDILV
ncbi:hypothetical protein RR48_05356 [Papilio machaon]|uniref:Uncharacterized protein n=1 Tax=Papilio machaon TaxID=76193 RepID=A0A0N0PDA3_PAPMA|nr:hypothetical protein RR48_05356 [Papilio machaon]